MVVLLKTTDLEDGRRFPLEGDFVVGVAVCGGKINSCVFEKLGHSAYLRLDGFGRIYQFKNGTREPVISDDRLFTSIERVYMKEDRCVLFLTEVEL